MIYNLLRLLFNIHLRLFHLVEITGKENIPAKGPVILCANHSSYFDSMLVALCTRRAVRFLIYKAFYDHDILGFFIKGCGAIPVTQKGSDREALRKGLNVLRSGGVLGIFPEGRLSRTGLLSSAKPGAALLAAASAAPIVPISISGAFFVYPKGRRFPRAGRITVRVHPPIKPEHTGVRDRGRLDRLTKRVMAPIKESLRSCRRRRRRTTR